MIFRYNNKEKTFNVVRQEFKIKANIPMPVDKNVSLDNVQQLKDMFINMSENFSCTLCGLNFPTEVDLMSHKNDDCLRCITCSVRFLNSKLLKKHYGYTGHSRKMTVGQETREDCETGEIIRSLVLWL